MATTKVTANVLADNSVTQAKLADDAVGADELAANAVVNASIASGAAIDMDKLDGDSLANAITDFAQDDLVILSDTSDSGNLVKITTSNFEDAIFGNISGDVTLAAGGAATLAAAQTNITSVLNTSLVLGRDADNQIKFGTDNQIIFEVDGGDNVIFKASGEIEASSLDISGDVDVDGTLEADAITINGTTLAETISDTVGAMVGSNTETGIAVTYDDSDNTLDFVIGSGVIASSMIAGDAIDGSKIADDAVDSEHYTDGSIDTAHLGDLQVTTAKIAADAITGAKLADDAVNSEHYTDGSIDTAHIADDQVTHAKLEARYTAKATSTSTGNQNLDASTATTFLLTGNVGTATLTIQNMKLGQAIDIVLSGTLSSAAITLATNFSSATIRKVGTTELDTSATNVITAVCIDDNDSAALVHYTINTFATDTTP
tara:strand:+ start:134 stop:1429 length:1296 start_codon:yes stop_codon:yes gene_type:complete